MHYVFNRAGFHLWNISCIRCRIWLFSSFLLRWKCISGLILLFTHFSFMYKSSNYSLNNTKLFTERTRVFLCTQLKTDLKGLFSFELWPQPVVISCIRDMGPGCFSLGVQYNFVDLLKGRHLVDNLSIYIFTLLRNWSAYIISPF